MKNSKGNIKLGNGLEMLQDRVELLKERIEIETVLKSESTRLLGEKHTITKMYEENIIIAKDEIDDLEAFIRLQTEMEQ